MKIIQTNNIQYKYCFTIIEHVSDTVTMYSTLYMVSLLHIIMKISTNTDKK